MHINRAWENGKVERDQEMSVKSLGLFLQVDLIFQVNSISSIAAHQIQILSIFSDSNCHTQTKDFNEF